MKYLILALSIFTISVSGQGLLPNPSTVSQATVNAALGGSIAASGTDTYTGSLTGLTTYTGFACDIQFANANTGAATLNITGATVLGAKTLKKYLSGSLADLAAGDIQAGARIRFYYNGTYLVMMGSAGTDSNAIHQGINTLTKNTFIYGNKAVAFGVDSTFTDNLIDGFTVSSNGTGISLSASSGSDIGAFFVQPDFFRVSTKSGSAIEIDNTPNSGDINLSSTSGKTKVISGDFYVTAKPARNDTLNNLLAWNYSTGKFQLRKASSISGGGGGSLGTITADPFHYPTSGDSFDVFGGRTRGNLQSFFNAYTLPVVTGLNNRFVIDGNSQGDGAALSDTTKRYGTVAAAILGGTAAGYTYKNFAVAGQTTVNMNSDAVSQIDGSYVAGKSKNYLAAFEVENDALLNPGSSSATLYSHISSYWSGRKTAGYYVIAMTSPLRGVYTTVQDLTINQRIEAVNTSIRSGTSDYNTLIDIPAIPRLSNFRSRVGFINDNLHFNVSGQADLADRVVSKIRADLSQQDYTPPNFMSWNGNTPDRSMIVGSLNAQPLGFITNGKVRGEFESFGTFDVNAHVVGSSDIPFNTKNQAIGVFINPGLKAGANDDIMSALTIQTEYFDPVTFTGTISDNFTINKQLTTTTHTNLLRIGANGEMSITPKLSGVATSAITINPTITGPSSGNYIENSISGTYTYNANNQAHTTLSISPNLTRGSFSSVTETTLDINSGSTATSADKAINVSVAEGTGIAIGASGTGNGMNIISGSSGAGLLSLMTAGSGIPAIMFKTSGTAVVQRNITNSASTGLLDMHSFERGATNQTAGSGIDNYVLLTSDAGNTVRAFQEDYYWITNVNASENSAVRWSNVIAGTLTEGMRLEGKNLIVKGNLNIASMSTAGVLVNDASGNVTSTTAPTLSLDNVFLKTSTQASGRNVLSSDNNSIVYFTNTSPVSMSIVTGLTLGFHCRLLQTGAAGSIVVSGSGTTVIGATSTTNIGDMLDIYYYKSSETYVVTLIPAPVVSLRKAGSFSGAGTATTVFTVTFGNTQANTSYKVLVTPTSALSAALFYVTNKTTTTFDVTYLAGLTGTVTFDWLVEP